MNNKCDQNINFKRIYDLTLDVVSYSSSTDFNCVDNLYNIRLTLSGHLQIGFVFISSTAKNQSICSATHKSQGVSEILISN